MLIIFLTGLLELSLRLITFSLAHNSSTEKKALTQRQKNATIIRSAVMKAQIILPPFMRRKRSSQLGSSSSSFSKDEEDKSGEKVTGGAKQTSSVRRVSFAEMKEVWKPGCVYLTPEELSRCFYSAEDKKDFERDRVYSVMTYEIRVESGLPWDEDEQTLRGLEDYFLEKPKQETRREHVLTVLYEQQRQRDMGEWPNPEKLRGVSVENAGEEVGRAIAIGQQDASVVHGD